MECLYDTGTVHSQRIIPTGLTELTFILGDKISSNSTTGCFNSHTLLTGQQNRFYDLNASGKLKLLTVTMRPNGLSQLMKVSSHELLNQTICAEDIWGQSVIDLCDRIFHAGNLNEQIRLVEQFLTKHISKQSPCYKSERINSVIPQINPVNALSIQSMAEHTCWSRKQFERSFTSLVGCTPKQFSNIVRFQYALHLKSQQSNLSLLDVALNCGFYDQAHMSNEFIKFSGLTPSCFFSSCPPQSDYFDF